VYVVNESQNKKLASVMKIIWFIQTFWPQLG
jgi:hypothetical protein